MEKYVNVEKLIEKIQDMGIRGSWICGSVDQEDLVTQIIGTIVRTAMEDRKMGEIHGKITPHESGIYQVDCITRESLSAADLARHDFKLKEVVYIPYCNKKVAFRVEHVTDEKAYLVAVDCIGDARMTDMYEYLDNFMRKLPEDLLDICGEIEHKVNGQLIRKNKVALLSLGNTSGCENCNGVDDIRFEGLWSEADRSKNDTEGKTCWYWEDTPYNYKDWDEDSYDSDSKSFRLVTPFGRSNSDRDGASSSLSVCPCICILRNRI